MDVNELLFLILSPRPVCSSYNTIINIVKQ